MSQSSKWFKITSALGFLAFISFAQINSAWADAHNFNGIMGWTGLGILFTVGAILALIKTAKESN